MLTVCSGYDHFGSVREIKGGRKFSLKDIRRHYAQGKGGKLQLRPYMLDITWEAILEEEEPWKKLWPRGAYRKNAI